MHELPRRQKTCFPELSNFVSPPAEPEVYLRTDYVFYKEARKCRHSSTKAHEELIAAPNGLQLVGSRKGGFALEVPVFPEPPPPNYKLTASQHPEPDIPWAPWQR